MERTIIENKLVEKEYLPILKMSDGRDVTADMWRERRKEIRSLLETYSYGVTPKEPERVWGEVVSESYLPTMCADHAGEMSVPEPCEKNQEVKACCDSKRCIKNQEVKVCYESKQCIKLQKIKVYFETENGIFSIPAESYMPVGAEKPPVFLHIAFQSVEQNPEAKGYVPVERITGAGYALVVVCYQDIVNDNHHGDFSDGLAAYFNTQEKREPDEWGKIGMWAYGLSRVLDYIIADRNDLDGTHVAVIGHSRLGKTALWTAAQDERFFCAISNNSGYGGAASSKYGKGERVQDFINVGSWDWFCENFKLFTEDKEDAKPYDQSFLLALIAPRYLCVGSASEDQGADPESEFLTTLWASGAWNLLGYEGLVTCGDMPEPGDHFAKGNIGYHLRAGRHALLPEDWEYYIQFMDRKIAGE